jgi:hypothetical protein
MANKQKDEYEDIKLNTRTILIGLWTVLMLLYIYCDSFYPVGSLNYLLRPKKPPPLAVVM